MNQASLQEYLGLGNYKPEVITNFEYPNKYYIHFSKQFELPLALIIKEDPSILCEEVFKSFVDDLQNSEAVTAAKDKLTKENIELKNKLEEAKTRIIELEPFEQYYNLALKMEHGEKV